MVINLCEHHLKARRPYVSAIFKDQEESLILLSCYFLLKSALFISFFPPQMKPDTYLEFDTCLSA